MSIDEIFVMPLTISIVDLCHMSSQRGQRYLWKLRQAGPFLTFN